MKIRKTDTLNDVLAMCRPAKPIKRKLIFTKLIIITLIMLSVVGYINHLDLTQPIQLGATVNHVQTGEKTHGSF